MNKYIEMKKRHQEEINKFPIYFAFGEEQFARKMNQLGLFPDSDLDKIVSIGTGGFILKEDVSAFNEMFERHRKEKQEAIDADVTGKGFIQDMFYAELKNHEYGYMLDVQEAIESLGYTYEQINADFKLKMGLQRASRKIRIEEGYETDE